MALKQEAAANLHAAFGRLAAIRVFRNQVVSSTPDVQCGVYKEREVLGFRRDSLVEWLDEALKLQADKVRELGGDPDGE